jgi:hypothetical protein
MSGVPSENKRRDGHSICFTPRRHEEITILAWSMLACPFGRLCRGRRADRRCYHAVDDRAPRECLDRINRHEVDGRVAISKLEYCLPITRSGDLRTPQSVDKAFCSFQYIVTTSWIIRLRTEDRLLTVRSIYRCPPTHAVSPDCDAIASVLFILGRHCRCPWRDLEAAIATRKSRGSVSSRSRRRRQPYMAARPSAIDRSAETVR